MNITSMFVKQVRILGSRLGTMSDTLDAARHLSAGRFRRSWQRLSARAGQGGAELMERGSVIGKVIVRADA